MSKNKLFSDVQFWILLTGVAGIIATSYYTVMSDKRDKRSFEIELNEKFESVMLRARNTGEPDIDDLRWALDLSNKQCEYYGIADNGLRLQKLAWGALPANAADLNASMSVIRLVFDSMNAIAENGCTSADIRSHQEVPFSRELYLVPSKPDPSIDPESDRFFSVWRYATDERYKIALVDMDRLPRNQRRDPALARIPSDYPVYRIRRADGDRYPALLMSDLFEQVLKLNGVEEMCFITDCHGSNQSCNNCFTNPEGQILIGD